MPLSWNEIRHRAIGFSKEWTGAKSEQAEKQTFWNEFFDVFGIRRRAVASFEEPVKRISGQYGYIDLFWPGIVLVEHKSFGKDLGKAESQAFRYLHDLAREGRLDEIPRYVIISDFSRIALHDLEPTDQRVLPLFDTSRVHSLEFPLADLHKHIHDFAFIPGYKQHKFEEQDPINIEAVEIMGRLHDALEAGGYFGHQLERFLVRILFCLFAQNTGIFERESFTLYLLNRTAPDGSDLGLHLARLFEVLNTPTEARQKNLDETLAEFRYVNGDLFAENLRFADFNRDMRDALIACTKFDWSRISPAIFGSLFQAVMEPKQRRQIGGHYTSERDILKLIRSLFLDDLRQEFERSKNNKAELRRFHEKIAALRFLDPACGCGNFLVVTYRELRILETDVLKVLYPNATQQELDVQRLSLVDVDAFYGIEISEWPARIAEVAMWLMDHQMNIRLSEAFGQYFVRLPLKKSPTIVQNNALHVDWKAILSPKDCSYVLGNPPFVGKKEQNEEQKADMNLLFKGVKGAGVLDYVCGWYVKAAEYIQGTKIRVAFVSTNSISQGEQVGILWQVLYDRFHLDINFAHRTFAWQSEARGKAHVHVVIIGFAAFPATSRTLFEYHDIKGAPVASQAKNINPYLADAPNTLLLKRGTQVSTGPEISYGSMANDKRKKDKGLGNLILDSKARAELIKETAIAPFIRKFVGSDEFINNTERWCLWLVDAPPEVIRSSDAVTKRLEAVKLARSESDRPETKRLAATPQLFGEIRQPKSEYLIVPKVSSETRPYLPVGFMEPSVIANGSALIVTGATPYHFGILSSAMHMAWMRYTCGRMKSDYQYSSQIVYNNFPWPASPTSKQIENVSKAANTILEERKKFPDATLADLYDPLVMPPSLAEAHRELDQAVDLCYRPQPFESDRIRVAYLFGLYEDLMSPLTAGLKKKKKKKPE